MNHIEHKHDTRQEGKTRTCVAHVFGKHAINNTSIFPVTLQIASTYEISVFCCGRQTCFSQVVNECHICSAYWQHVVLHTFNRYFSSQFLPHFFIFSIKHRKTWQISTPHSTYSKISACNIYSRLSL